MFLIRCHMARYAFKLYMQKRLAVGCTASLFTSNIGLPQPSPHHRNGCCPRPVLLGFWLRESCLKSCLPHLHIMSENSESNGAVVASGLQLQRLGLLGAKLLDSEASWQCSTCGASHLLFLLKGWPKLLQLPWALFAQATTSLRPGLPYSHCSSRPRARPSECPAARRCQQTGQLSRLRAL